MVEFLSSQTHHWNAGGVGHEDNFLFFAFLQVTGYVTVIAFCLCCGKMGVRCAHNYA